VSFIRAVCCGYADTVLDRVYLTREHNCREQVTIADDAYGQCRPFAATNGGKECNLVLQQGLSDFDHIKVHGAFNSRRDHPMDFDAHVLVPPKGPALIILVSKDAEKFTRHSCSTRNFRGR
jgi:hypothetical protein